MLTAKYVHPDWGYEKEALDTFRLLRLNQEYKVEYISMGQSYTTVYLVGFWQAFNSVHFDFFEDGKEIDIFRSSKYNPYLRED